MATKFAQVKAGLEFDAARNEVKAQWKRVLSQVPRHRQKMAMLLLESGRMTDAEIITTCHVGLTPEGDTPTGEQALFAQGMTDAAALLSKPVPTIPEAYPAASKELRLDPALYAAGADMAKSLKPFMASAR